MKPRIKAIYISVLDMERAVKFYEKIFEEKISNFDKRMSSFDFWDLSFLLFNPIIDEEKVYYWNNTIPNIEVENIEKMLEFIKKENCKIIMPLEEIDWYKIFQSEDTEWNIIEFYEIIK